MEDSERLKAYAAMADVSRKWVSAMDTKAGFISALCIATVTFVWTGAKLAEAQGFPRLLAVSATALLMLALFLALKVVLPRVTLFHAHGTELEYTGNHQPISFYQYVADNFPVSKHAEFVRLVEGMDAKALAREALEQHYTISHVLSKKSAGVALAGWIWLTASALTAIAMVLGR